MKERNNGADVDIYLMTSLGIPTMKNIKNLGGRQAIIVADNVLAYCLKEKRDDLQIMSTTYFLDDYTNQHYSRMSVPKALWTPEEVNDVKEKYEQKIARYPPQPLDSMTLFCFGNKLPPMIRYDRASINTGVAPFYRVPMTTAPLPSVTTIDTL